MTKSTSSPRKTEGRLARQAPPLSEVIRGSLLERRLRCGKPTCHCWKGDGHPAVYLTVSHPGGRNEQISLPAFLVPVVRRWVSNYDRLWKALEEISTLKREWIRKERKRGVHRR